jgi:hypothetical protein
LGQRFSAARERFSAVWQGVSALRQGVAALRQGFSLLGQGFLALERVAAPWQRVPALRQRLIALRQRLRGLAWIGHAAVSYSGFIRHDRRSLIFGPANVPLCRACPFIAGHEPGAREWSLHGRALVCTQAGQGRHAVRPVKVAS